MSKQNTIQEVMFNVANYHYGSTNGKLTWYMNGKPIPENSTPSKFDVQAITKALKDVQDFTVSKEFTIASRCINAEDKTSIDAAVKLLIPELRELRRRITTLGDLVGMPDLFETMIKSMHSGVFGSGDFAFLIACTDDNNNALADYSDYKVVRRGYDLYAHPVNGTPAVNVYAVLVVFTYIRRELCDIIFAKVWKEGFNFLEIYYPDGY